MQQDTGIDLSQVKVLSTLGAGGFGQVLLVQYGREHYALKCMKKAYVVEQGLVEHVKREKVCSEPRLVGW